MPASPPKAGLKQIIEQSGVPALILRVPMVLGEGDYATRALSQRAGSRVVFQFRAESLEQPIYAGDVLEAVLAGLGLGASGPAVTGGYDLAGPESLSRRALTHRAAEVLGVRPPTVISLPIALGMGLAGLLERLSASPPFTRAMLGVLDHDDHLDPGESLAALGLTLTPLNEACASAWRARKRRWNLPVARRTFSARSNLGGETHDFCDYPTLTPAAARRVAAVGDRPEWLPGIGTARGDARPSLRTSRR